MSGSGVFQYSSIDQLLEHSLESLARRLIHGIQPTNLYIFGLGSCLCALTWRSADHIPFDDWPKVNATKTFFSGRKVMARSKLYSKTSRKTNTSHLVYRFNLI